MSHFFGDCVSDLLDCAMSDSAFGESIEYTHTSKKVTRKLNGIFDEIFEQVDPDTEVTVATNLLTVGVHLSDLQFPPEKFDRIKIRGITYKVIDAQEDGQGGSELHLHMEC